MDERLTDEQVAEIGKRCDAATEGPWVENHWASMKAEQRIMVEASKPYRQIVHPKDGIPSPQDAAFIAHARADVPALLADRRVREARLAELAEVAASVKAWGGHHESCCGELEPRDGICACGWSDIKAKLDALGTLPPEPDGLQDAEAESFEGPESEDG